MSSTRRGPQLHPARGALGASAGPRGSLPPSPGEISRPARNETSNFELDWGLPDWPWEILAVARCTHVFGRAAADARQKTAAQKRGGTRPELRDPSSPGWLSGRPKTPAGARRRLSIQTETRTLAKDERCLLAIRPKHRCTRRPRAKHASHGALSQRLAWLGCQAFALRLLSRARSIACRTIGLESLAQPSSGALAFFCRNAAAEKQRRPLPGSSKT